ncbi:GIY-YIG catalytic protein [Candidatus Saccharibacteria bacterium RAAC3_TM7_1]|nr:GIY-YIG catalytic protein [Candidatus Saccharibacteria bacterium RAAC3_TM7_1]HCZ28773.1 excinuclease ABC subunit C [Candidatus Saccharibacteria bacterium]
MYYFYVLRSQKDSKLYYGQTTDLRRRFELHNTGQVPATKQRRPLELIYYEAYNSKELAIKREHTVKRSGTARDALQKRITGS